MSTISRRLTRTLTVVAGILAGGVAVSSAAIAQEGDAEQRSVLTIGVTGCGGDLSVGYDDLVDGHTPQQVTEVLADQSGELWRSTEVHQVEGDYFNFHRFPATAAIPITQESVFTYSVTITYEDGVTQTQEVGLAIADHCTTGPPPTTGPAPSTTAPQATAPGGQRFEVTRGGADCSGGLSTAAITFLYRDTVDGHLTGELAYQLVAGGQIVAEDPGGPPASVGFDGEVFEWMVPSEFFDVDRLEPTTYTLTVWVRYLDDVLVSDSASYDVAAPCAGEEPTTTRAPSSPTTTQPSGTLPQTGASMTVGIAAMGGLLSVAGAVLLAGVRRRKSL